MSLKVHNSLTRQKEDFEPRESGKVSIYVCGPTVYDHIHIGNARASIVFDTIRRYLRWRGFDVTFVENYTDIDDKIIAKASEEGISAQDVATKYAVAFEEVMAVLRVDPPDKRVKATDHIGDMIRLIEGLLEKEYAYTAGGSVWFSVEKFEGYGKLSGRSLEDLPGGERIEPDPSKRNPLDFALWKAGKAGEPSWPSPWGEGRPGWHIECSAMSLKHLGMGFDIHGGGKDLIFPHHENEIAQSEAFYGGAPFVRYWLHNGMVNIDREKMSKSLRNFILLKDLLGKYSPQVVRLLAVGSHYRSDVDFGESQLENARATFERLEIFFQTVSAALGGVAPSQDAPPEHMQRFRAAMDDDFNTPEALAVLHEIVRLGNVELDAMARGERPPDALSGLFAAFLEICGVFCITPKPRRELDEAIEDLVKKRDRARAEERFDEADAIRKQLSAEGIVLEDTPAGTRWRRGST